MFCPAKAFVAGMQSCFDTSSRFSQGPNSSLAYKTRNFGSCETFSVLLSVQNCFLQQLSDFSYADWSRAQCLIQFAVNPLVFGLWFHLSFEHFDIIS